MTITVIDALFLPLIVIVALQTSEDDESDDIGKTKDNNYFGNMKDDIYVQHRVYVMTSMTNLMNAYIWINMNNYSSNISITYI